MPPVGVWQTETASLGTAPHHLRHPPGTGANAAEYAQAAGPRARGDKLGVLLSETQTLVLTRRSGAESAASRILDRQVTEW